MKIGMNLLLWSSDVSEEMLPVLEQLKAMGYDGVELPIFDLDPDKWAKWSKRLDDLGLERTAVTVRGEEDNPISDDSKSRLPKNQSRQNDRSRAFLAINIDPITKPFRNTKAGRVVIGLKIEVESSNS